MNLQDNFGDSYQDNGIGNSLTLHPPVKIKPLKKTAIKQLTKVHKH